MNKENLLVFGGGPLQVSIIKNAINLGFYVIVIDPDENAIGKNFANKFVKVEGNDFDKTLEIAKKYNVKGIVTAATDKPLLMMARIANELSLNFPNYESILNTIDKARLKNILERNNFAHAKGGKYTRHTLPDTSEINYPVIIKPTINSGSRGVIYCKDSSSFTKSIEKTFAEADGEILIEEFIEGDEISVEALVLSNEVKILQITDKQVTAPPYNVEVGQIQPSKYKDEYFKPLSNYLQKLIEILKLNNCAIHPEFKINKKGIYLLEMGPRLGGDFITSHLVPLSTGINMEKALIQIATKNCVNLIPKHELAAMIRYLQLPENTLIKGSPAIEKYYSTYPNLILIENRLKPGAIVRKTTNSLNRYGYYIIYGKDINDLQKISNKINKQLLNDLTLY